MARSQMLRPKSAPASLLAFAVAALVAAPLPAAAPTGDDLADAPSGSAHLYRTGGRRLKSGGGSSGGSSGGTGVPSDGREDDDRDVEIVVQIVETFNLSEAQRDQVLDKIGKLGRRHESKTYVYARVFQACISNAIFVVLVNRPVLIGAACVWVAVNTVGQVEPYYEVTKWYSAYLTFLSATVVLNIFYCKAGGEWWMHDNPVWCSIFFVFLGVALRQVFKQRKWCADWSRPYQEPSFVDQAEHPGAVTPIPPKILKVTNRYQEVSYPFMQVVFLFFVQTTLLMFYMIEIHENVGVHDGEEVSCFKWFLGVCIVFSVGGDEMGTGFNPDFWDKLEDPEHKLFLNLPSHHFQGCLTHKNEWRIRKWMSFLINSAGKWYILSTFPILLSNGDEYEFIMDCMATWFITSLDDLPSEKELKEDMMAELRAEEKAGRLDGDQASEILAEISGEVFEYGQGDTQSGGELRERHSQRGDTGLE